MGHVEWWITVNIIHTIITSKIFLQMWCHVSSVVIPTAWISVLQCLLQSDICSIIILHHYFSSVCLQLMKPTIMWQTNSLAWLLPQSTYVGKHSTSPSCFIFWANFNICSFVMKCGQQFYFSKFKIHLIFANVKWHEHFQ